MKINIRQLFDQDRNETGSILWAGIDGPTTEAEKAAIERQLHDYAITRLYPRQPLNFFRHWESDTPALTVIRGIDKLPQRLVNL